MPERRLAIAIKGGVALGAYEAGVIVTHDARPTSWLGCKGSSNGDRSKENRSSSEIFYQTLYQRDEDS
jgi:hypothetical protein